MKTVLILAIVAIVVIISSCAPQSTVRTARDVDPSSSVEGLGGLGIESRDIINMTREMVVDILSHPVFANATTTPSIIIDDRRFLNESNQVINIDMLLDRLRIELMRESRGKLDFIARKHMDLAQEEQRLEMEGYTERKDSSDSIFLAGAKYRMVGKITSLSTASNVSGVRSNYYVFSFEIIDLDSTRVVWGNFYEIKRYGADDTLYY